MLSNSFVILVRRGVRNETERKGAAVRAASVLHSLAKALGYGEMRPGLGLGCSLWIWLITLLEKEILEERIGGQRIREKMLGKELGRIRKNTGFGFWEEEWFVGTEFRFIIVMAHPLPGILLLILENISGCLG
nr:hypothetical protein Iba_chr14cCG1400 [Ipomoea batatas]